MNKIPLVTRISWSHCRRVGTWLLSVFLVAASAQLFAQAPLPPAQGAKKPITAAELEQLVRARQLAIQILDKVEANCLAAPLTPADEKTLTVLLELAH